MSESVKKRIEKLRKLIAYHRTLYHTFDKPELSDASFDALKNELEELERKYPQYSDKNSPTQTVGGEPLDKFVKVRHEVPMLSFFDAFNEQEMKEWQKRVETYIHAQLKTSSKSEALFYGELKIDGLAIELVYENGVLQQASTRGDGTVGEDVTQNIKTIATIPQKLEQLGFWKIPKHVVIRGEVFIPLAELERINIQQKKQNLKPYANSRNLAAGSVRQLDPAITASRKLESFQYDIVIGTPAGVYTHEEKHRVLASWGCRVNPHNQALKNLEEVFEFRNQWEKKREKLEYEIDGIVVIVNDNALFERAGIVGKAPRGAIAYKFSPKEATTILERVEFQVGRTGVITPVATLKPIEISGVTITHATLHNFDEIKRLDVRIGDTVTVTRSGDVIPKIIRAFPELRTGKEKIIIPPAQCPIDGAKTVYDGVLLKCSNRQCGARNRNQIIHFVSRNAFNIRGMGKKIVDRFLDEGLIGDAGDIFSLREQDISVLDGFGEKSARNLIQEIKEAKHITLSRFLYALGIPQIGEEMARALAQRLMHDSKKESISVRDVSVLAKKYSIESLQEIPDVGPKVAADIHAWFNDPHNQKLIKKLHQAGIVLEPEIKTQKGPLNGKTFCITGTLQTMSRSRAKEIIEQAGGVFHAAITKQVNVLIVGVDAGSKLAKAKELGIEIWDEKQFLEKIKK